MKFNDNILRLEQLSTLVIAGYLWTTPEMMNYVIKDSDLCKVVDSVQILMLYHLKSAEQLSDQIHNGLLAAGESIQKFMLTKLCRNPNLMPSWAEQDDCLSIGCFVQTMGTIGHFLVWDSFGGLNEQSTIARILQSGKLDNWKKFVLAKQYFVHPNIKTDVENQVLTDYLTSLAGSNAMLSQLVYRVMTYRFPRTFDEAFLFCNIRAAELFLQRMDKKEREEKSRNLDFFLKIMSRGQYDKGQWMISVYFALSVLVQKSGDQLLSSMYVEQTAISLNKFFVGFRSFHGDQIIKVMDRLVSIAKDKNATMTRILYQMIDSVICRQRTFLYQHFCKLWQKNSTEFKDEFCNSSKNALAARLLFDYGFRNIEYTRRFLILLKTKTGFGFKHNQSNEFVVECVRILKDHQRFLANLDVYLKTFIVSDRQIRLLKKSAIESQFGRKLLANIISEKRYGQAKDILRWALDSPYDY